MGVSHSWVLVNTHGTPIGDDIEPVDVFRDDFGTGNDEDEEPLEAEISRVTMNPKNPTNREEKEHEDWGRAAS